MSYTIEVTEVGGPTVTLQSVTHVIEVNNLALPPLGRTRAIAFVIDGGGTPVSTGSKGYLTLPFDCEVSEWTLVADQIGDIVVDIKRATYSGFPTTVSIAGSEKPTLSNAQKNQDTNLTTWTTDLSAGDILEYYVDSSAAVFRITVVLKVLV